MTKRHGLTDAQWEKIKPLLPLEKPKTGRRNHDHRTMLNGMIWRTKTGTPWRDLPERYGKWKTVCSRWLRWRDAGVWERVWEVLQQEGHHKGEVAWEIDFIDSRLSVRTNMPLGQKKYGGSRSVRAQSWRSDPENPVPCRCGLPPV